MQWIPGLLSPPPSRRPGDEAICCREGKVFCEYDRTAKIRHFTLKIRELQTFTSYRFEDGRPNEDILGPPGDTYYLSNGGFNSSLSPTRNDSISTIRSMLEK